MPRLVLFSCGNHASVLPRPKSLCGKLLWGPRRPLILGHVGWLLPLVGFPFGGIGNAFVLLGFVECGVEVDGG